MCSLGQLQVTEWLPSSPFLCAFCQESSARADENPTLDLHPCFTEPADGPGEVLGYGVLCREEARVWAWL